MKFELIRKTSKRIEAIVGDATREELVEMIRFVTDLWFALDWVREYKDDLPRVVEYKDELKCVVKEDEEGVIIGIEYKGCVYDCMKIDGADIGSDEDSLKCAFLLFDLIRNYSHLIVNAKDSNLWRVLCTLVVRLTFNEFKEKNPKQYNDYLARKNN